MKEQEKTINIELNENEVQILFSIFDSALKFGGMAVMSSVHDISSKIHNIISQQNLEKNEKAKKA